ncbi:MAG: tetratricopeptide repeat protein, partial [Candidatus Heimdallarchaeota archaeon]|nr:tetratricopeptide repeat protein [Candidatus Heimdallarchaeota archaeon]
MKQLLIAEIIVELNEVLSKAIGSDDFDPFFDKLGRYLKKLKLQEKFQVYKDISSTLLKQMKLQPLNVITDEYWLLITEHKDDHSKYVETLQNLLSIRSQLFYHKCKIESYGEAVNQHLKFFIKINDSLGQANAYSDLGIYYLKEGNQDKAQESYERSIQIAKKIDNHKRLGVSLNNLGIVYQERDQLHEAIKHHLQSFDILTEIGSEDKLPPTINSLGWAYFRLGWHVKALELYNQAIEISQRNNDNRNLSVYLANVGAIHNLRGDLNLAQDYYLQQLEINKI